MDRKRTFIAIIPARGGSKRLPRKNVLDLGGKPLIAWTIEAVRICPKINEVMVTTDDKEIADVARKYGANVPFIRPAALANDTASSFEAIKHTLEHYKHKLEKEFDFVVLLQPTSPLRNVESIMGAIELLEKKNADAVISVCEVDHSPLWTNTLPRDLSLDNFLRNDVKNMRSQDLPLYYRLNGAIYICRTERLLAEKTFFISSNSFAYVMKKEESIDIDDLYDLKMAKSVLTVF